MMSLLLSVMSWSALLFCILSSCLIVWSGIRRHIKEKLKPSSEPEMYNHGPQPQGRRTVWISTLTLTLIAGIGIGHAATLISDAFFPAKLEEVLIIATHPDGSHVVTDKYGREFSAKWCSGPDDLVPGNKLPLVWYRQQLGCKNIRGMFLGYSVYSYKDGTRMVFPIPKENANAR